MNKVQKVICHVVQHVALVVGVVLLTTALLSSYVRYETVNGVQSTFLNNEGRQKDFEDSKIFNQLMKEQALAIVRYGAIRGQLETDGVYDANKVIDVTAYANRFEGVPSRYVTADYYLEDLIRWGKYGIEYVLTETSGTDFLSGTTQYTVISNAGYGSYHGNISPYNTDLSNSVEKIDVSGNSLSETLYEDVYAGDWLSGESGENTELLQHQLIVNRYQTVDGKNIENYVSDWDAYDALRDSLTATIRDLAENYALCEKYYDYYDETGSDAKSNVVYLIRKTIGNKTEVYTNMDTERTDLTSLEMALKETCDRYILYDAQDLRYESNTQVTEGELRRYISDYGYAYPENLQIMIGVNRDRAVKDCFVTTGAAYQNAVPDFTQNIIIAVIWLLVFLAMVILLTVKEGVVRDKETGEKTYVLHVEDKIPTEIFLVLFAIAMGLLIGVCVQLFFDGMWISDLYTLYQRNGVILFTAGIALLGSLLCSFFYYSLVRRIRAHRIWTGSLLRWVIVQLKKAIHYMQNHKSIVVRVWMPFLGFAGVNLLAVILADQMMMPFVVFIGIVLFDALVGIVCFRNAVARQNILQVINRICKGDLNAKVDETTLNGDNLVLAKAVNRIGDSVRDAVETSMKDERLKADLITNVSHDLKTPLTSIINYVDLIKREQVDNPKVQEYIEVLDTKSQRLKQLTEDLLEASKISSGNIVLHMERINLVELLNQTLGEFSEKFEQKGLIPVVNAPSQAIYVLADSRRSYRVMENLFNNIFKYALEGTRIYIDLGFTEWKSADGNGSQAGVFLSMKNISAMELNVAPEELTERFIRGDESRTTEGSGLGLSIAKNLTEAMNGMFEISIDGDLFKVVIVFPKMDDVKPQTEV